MARYYAEADNTITPSFALPWRRRRLYGRPGLLPIVRAGVYVALSLFCTPALAESTSEPIRRLGPEGRTGPRRKLSSCRSIRS